VVRSRITGIKIFKPVNGRGQAIWFSALRAAGILLALTAAGFGQVTINEFNLPTATSGPLKIASGPDGNLWFTEFNSGKIGRITPAGLVTEFAVPNAKSGLGGIASGPDGNLWFTETGSNKIGRITTSGVVTEFLLPASLPASNVTAIAAGPDGNLWFGENSLFKIGRITISGVVTDFGIPTFIAAEEIALGPDGNLWFTEDGFSRIGRISTSGDITEFTLPAAGCYPDGIAAGPDGNLWFTESNSNKIGRITPSGVIAEFPVPTTYVSTASVTSDLALIASGPDGNLWFTEYFSNKIGRITPTGVITEFTVPTANSEPDGIALGPDGNLWFAEYAAGKIGRIFVGGIVTATPAALSFQYQAGGPAPSPAKVVVNGNETGLSYSVAVTTSNGGNWLTVDKSNGVTPGTLTVSVNTADLAPVKTYQGSVSIIGTGTASGPIVIPVTLTITAPLPTITAVYNAASFSSGPVSPGEIVSIFGTAMGPSSPLGITLDPAGKVSTSLGNVQVLFNGTAAPLIFVSASQINCVAPYEVVGASNPFVEVRYLGQNSNVINLTAAASAPAIFAIGSPAGTGQGAILNSDNGPNSSNLPAAAGSVVQVYMTGEGQLSPAGVTGSVTCSTGCAAASQIPAPLLKAAALVNSQPATIAFIGEAPGFVSGVLQVNVVIPQNTPTGNVPLAISIGGVYSQANVTVAVK